MNRLKGIKNIADLKELLILHKESIKKAALPITVVAALLFFWFSGSGENKSIEELDEPTTEIVAENEEADNVIEQNINADIYVDIGGCVYNPGVYKVKSGTRLFQVIEKAGGLTEDADTDSINQAEEIYDGQKILIYSRSDNYTGTLSENIQQESSTGKININYATSLELQEIPGVGPSIAQKIIEYREANGRFKSIEDIMNISGIGEKTFQSLKDYITV